MSTMVTEETEPAWVTHNFVSAKGFAAWLDEINFLGADATWSGSFGDSQQRAINRWKNDGGCIKVERVDELLMLRGIGLWEVPEILWRKTDHARTGPIEAGLKIECVARVRRGQDPKDVGRDADVDPRSVKRWVRDAKKDADWEQKTIDSWERHVQRQRDKEAREMEASIKKLGAKAAGRKGKGVQTERRVLRGKFQKGEITLVQLMLNPAYTKMELRRLIDTVAIVPEGFTPNEVLRHVTKRTGFSTCKKLGSFTRAEAASVAVSIDELSAKTTAPANAEPVKNDHSAERKLVIA